MRSLNEIFWPFFCVGAVTYSFPLFSYVSANSIVVVFSGHVSFNVSNKKYSLKAQSSARARRSDYKDEFPALPISPVGPYSKYASCLLHTYEDLFYRSGSSDVARTFNMACIELKRTVRIKRRTKVSFTLLIAHPRWCHRST